MPSTSGLQLVLLVHHGHACIRKLHKYIRGHHPPSSTAHSLSGPRQRGSLALTHGAVSRNTHHTPLNRLIFKHILAKARSTKTVRSEVVACLVNLLTYIISRYAFTLLDITWKHGIVLDLRTTAPSSWLVGIVERVEAEVHSRSQVRPKTAIMLALD